MNTATPWKNVIMLQELLRDIKRYGIIYKNSNE